MKTFQHIAVILGLCHAISLTPTYAQSGSTIVGQLEFSRPCDGQLSKPASDVWNCAAESVSSASDTYQLQRSGLNTWTGINPTMSGSVTRNAGVKGRTAHTDSMQVRLYATLPSVTHTIDVQAELNASAVQNGNYQAFGAH
ncbi:MAG TPA: hypothetical protein VEQ63_06130, partial [Bryobacteraceae bacterium]|nr:hypothetical protein [Bryobacteraceae bacterium]